MGRKGVSKRKPSQDKSNSNANGGSGSSVSSVVRPSDRKPVDTFDTGKDGQSTKGGEKSGSDRKKNNK